MMTNQDLMKLFGQNLKQLRRQHGLSQQELANTLDMERSHLVAIEGGKKATSFNTLVKLSNIFKCSVAQFFSAINEATPQTTSSCVLHEFAQDYSAAKKAARIHTQNLHTLPQEAAERRIGPEILALIPLLSEESLFLMQKFAESYLNSSKHKDPLAEQIVDDVLNQDRSIEEIFTNQQNTSDLTTYKKKPY